MSCQHANSNLQKLVSIVAKSVSCLIKIASVGTALLLLSGCPDEIYDDDDSRYQSRPIYLSYEDLRQSIALEDPRPVTDIGRIYLFGNYFFINSRNNGVHVFNNTDPSSPINERFIKILGNTELSIRNGYLYADSYVDLVTLDLNNINNLIVTARTEDIFPWDAYQNVPRSVFFSGDQLDPERGVIIGYE